MVIDYFEGAITACHNAVNLKDSALALCNTKNAHHGLFHLYTAREELEKATFSLFAHYGYVTPQQIEKVFRSHAAKILLFDRIYRIMNIQNGEIYIGKTPLKNINIDDLVKQNKSEYENYKKARESCLYVEPKSDGTWSYPRTSIQDVEARKKEILEKLDGLFGFLVFLGDNELHGDIDNFKLLTKRPLGQPAQQNIMFSSTESITPRIRKFSQELSQKLSRA